MISAKESGQFLFFSFVCLLLTSAWADSLAAFVVFRGGAGKSIISPLLLVLSFSMQRRTPQISQIQGKG